MTRVLRTLLVVAGVATLAACSSTRPWINAPLEPGQVVAYDGLAQIADPARAADLLVVVSFSGGGSRAAAFAHATLQALDARPFTWRGAETTLARETDMVTGVSGGSVAAAHVALHGVAGHLQRFPDDFLRVDFQGKLVGSVVGPGNLYRMTSPWFGRGQLLAYEFDRLLFHGTTFGDLARLSDRPYLIVGATDLSSGAEFDFASDQFAALCSSIDDVPLSFAVAASSSVPLVFSPLGLANHALTCDAIQLQRQPQAPATAERDAARAQLVESEMQTLAEGKKRFVHLVDGGVSDNLGLRRIADYVLQAGGIQTVLASLNEGLGHVDPIPRRIVFVSVNSERSIPSAIDASGKVPGTIAVVAAITSGGLGRQSRETSLVFRESVDQWRRELRGVPDASGGSRDVDIFSVEIDLTEVPDTELRNSVLEIPTAFRVSETDTTLLRQAAEALIDTSPEYRRFLASIDAEPTNAPWAPGTPRKP